MPQTKTKLFIKVGQGGSNFKGDTLHRYEYEGLAHLRKQCDVNLLYVPEPHLYGVNEKNIGFICVEYLDIKYSAGAAAKLGKGLAHMHAFNSKEYNAKDGLAIGGNSQNSNNSDEKQMYKAYGFPMDGCCGAGRQLNDVNKTSQNWIEFWREYRLGDQLKVINERFPEDKKIQEVGAQLMKRLPELFSSMVVEDIVPSVLHGDLWSGNYGSITRDNIPVIFDPAVYYGHSEADLGIAKMFGGFGEAFWNAYFTALPKKAGFERRSYLYELHHHLNHYQIFGSGYRDGALSLMHQILSRKKK